MDRLPEGVALHYSAGVDTPNRTSDREVGGDINWPIASASRFFNNVSLQYGVQFAQLASIRT
jgi:hypothetical protein